MQLLSGLEFQAMVWMTGMLLHASVLPDADKHSRVPDCPFGPLLQAYQMLSILEGTSSMAQQAMQKGSKLKREDTHNLDFYFNKASICPWHVFLHSLHQLKIATICRFKF